MILWGAKENAIPYFKQYAKLFLYVERGLRSIAYPRPLRKKVDSLHGVFVGFLLELLLKLWDKFIIFNESLDEDILEIAGNVVGKIGGVYQDIYSKRGLTKLYEQMRNNVPREYHVPWFEKTIWLCIDPLCDYEIGEKRARIKFEPPSDLEPL